MTQDHAKIFPGSSQDLVKILPKSRKNDSCIVPNLKTKKGDRVYVYIYIYIYINCFVIFIEHSKVSVRAVYD